MRRSRSLAFSILLAALSAEAWTPATARACTNYLITRGASADGSTLITYAADAHDLYGELSYRPAAEHLPGEMVDVLDWDSGRHLGKIKQVPRTFAVIGNMNERQVSIGETTFGGRKELEDPAGIVDYGSLMYLALERSATAREAIKVMTDLVAEYGYASGGESFSIADAREVWILEMIGKGPSQPAGSSSTPSRRGALWVARKIPDGMISAHANMPRIRQFPLADKDTLYAKDVISFAREKGYFRGKDEEFSFADAYAPATFESLRSCELRVWSMFRRAAPSLGLSPDFAKGVAGAKRPPLWVKPDKKLSARDVMELMRDHFEGTEFDLAKGVGAGPYHLPYRWRPLRWEFGDSKYLNERSASTQQTGFSFVAQARSWLPDPIGGVLWFGVDDTASTVYVPIYAGTRRPPKPYATGTANFEQFSWDSAFWVFNFVANWAYSRYDAMIEDIRKVQRELESEFVARVPEIDRAAAKLLVESPERACDYLTEQSIGMAERTVARWKKLGESLIVKYLDGNVRDELGRVKHPGYPDDWYKRIAEESGDRLKLRRVEGQEDEESPVLVTGYFHSREEMGELAKNVPADFPFDREKLLLRPGKSKCAEAPRCCLSPSEKAGGGKLLIEVPKEKRSCGAPAWLVRVKKDEKRPLVEADEH